MGTHWFLLKELVKRDFQGRYAGSLLGFVWSFVQPLWLLLLYTLVFSTVLKVSLLGERTDSFGLFLFAGLLPWMALHEGVNRGATAITDNAVLVKKLSFPSEILVVTVVVAALLHEAIAGAVFLGVLALLGEPPFSSLSVLLLALPLQLALTLGLGLLLAAANVFFRDISQLLSMLLNAWFFLTPIVYPLSLVVSPESRVPKALQRLIELNPLTVLVELYRQAFLGAGPALVDGTGALAAAALVVLCAGFWGFRRLKAEFVDLI